MWIFRTCHMPACAVVWMLVMSAAATELYYEIPDNDSEYPPFRSFDTYALSLQPILSCIENENKLDPVAAYDHLERAEEELRKNRLLVTLLQYAQNLKDIDNKGSPSNKDEGEGVIWSDLLGLKEAGVKKWVTALSNKASSKLIPRWKIKKGTSVVCYFKLCSFKQSA